MLMFAGISLPEGVNARLFVFLIRETALEVFGRVKGLGRSP